MTTFDIAIFSPWSWKCTCLALRVIRIPYGNIDIKRKRVCLPLLFKRQQCSLLPVYCVHPSNTYTLHSLSSTAPGKWLCPETLYESTWLLFLQWAGIGGTSLKFKLTPEALFSVPAASLPSPSGKIRQPFTFPTQPRIHSPSPPSCSVPDNFPFPPWL